MASRFVEADEEFIPGLKSTKREVHYWTNVFQLWAKTRDMITSFSLGKDERKKMSNLKATKYHSLTNFSPHFFA